MAHESAGADALQSRFNQYASKYEVELAWPPVIAGSDVDDNKKIPRTSQELIHHRLWEAGVLAEVPVSLEEAILNLNQFVANMERTGCYHSVHVQLEPSKTSDSEEPQQQEIHVLLKEKNWYRVHAGAAVKTDEMFGNSQTGSSGFGRTNDMLGVALPTAELEFSAGLRNVSGTCDNTSIAYTLDTQQHASWTASHERPFYTMLPNPDAFLVLDNGSQISLQTKAFLSTLDFEWTRSYKEYQRGFMARICNHHSIPVPERAPGMYWGLTYQALLRDIIPKRGSLSGTMDASLPIVQQAGPNFKHAVTAELRQNGSTLDDAQLPTRGLDWSLSTEFAWSDVAFSKTQGLVGLHLPVVGNTGLAVHALLNGGYLHSLGRHSVSDRFFLGGPMNFRGFLPSGVGPRAMKTPQHQSSSSSSAAKGDALGGDFFYTLTAMASLPLPTQDFVPMRAFVFGTAGTCVGSLNHVWATQQQAAPWAILQSSRICTGLGVATHFLGSRMELTYAVPLRYGPTDLRRNVQIGMSINLDR